jgi:hypothetical protein
MFTSLVVIDDLDFVHTIVTPDEAQPPLIVDADAVLAPAVSLEQFKLVSGRYSQARQLGRSVQLHQLAPGNAFDIAKPMHRPAVKQGLGIGAREGPDHGLF